MDAPSLIRVFSVRTGHFVGFAMRWLLLTSSLSGWNELLIAAFSHRSISVKDGILLATGLHVHRSSAHQAGVGTIFDRVLTELVSKMREMKMDKTELGCLRAIVLFNPGIHTGCFYMGQVM